MGHSHHIHSQYHSSMAEIQIHSSKMNKKKRSVLIITLSKDTRKAAMIIRQQNPYHQLLLIMATSVMPLKYSIIWRQKTRRKGILFNSKLGLIKYTNVRDSTTFGLGGAAALP